MPRKVAIAFRSGDKNWKSRDERAARGGGEARDEKREGEEQEKERKEGTTPVTVHEKTNSVILFGRRAKPSV